MRETNESRLRGRVMRLPTELNNCSCGTGGCLFTRFCVKVARLIFSLPMSFLNADRDRDGNNSIGKRWVADVRWHQIFPQLRMIPHPRCVCDTGMCLTCIEPDGLGHHRRGNWKERSLNNQLKKLGELLSP